MAVFNKSNRAESERLENEIRKHLVMTEARRLTEISRSSNRAFLISGLLSIVTVAGGFRQLNYSVKDDFVMLGILLFAVTAGVISHFFARETRFFLSTTGWAQAQGIKVDRKTGFLVRSP